MTRRLAVGATAGATGAIALAYLLAFFPAAATAGAWLMVLGLATLIVALIALGILRGARGVGRLAWPLAFAFVVVVGGFGAALLLPPEQANTTVVLGFPLRAAIVIYGVGLLPMLVLPLAYALTFDAMTLRDEDLARVRAMGARHRQVAADRGAS